MVRDRRVIVHALMKKGFREDQADHKKYYRYHNDRRQGISTTVSHGSSHKTVDDSLLGKMAKQLKLKKPEFMELVDCTMDADRYIQALLSQGVDLSP